MAGTVRVKQTWNGFKVLRNVHTAVRKTMQETLNDARDKLELETPVLTGELKESIEEEIIIEGHIFQLPNKIIGIYGWTAPHGRFIELGTEYMDGRFILAETNDEIIKKFIQRLKRNVKRK